MVGFFFRVVWVHNCDPNVISTNVADKESKYSVVVWCLFFKLIKQLSQLLPLPFLFISIKSVCLYITDILRVNEPIVDIVNFCFNCIWIHAFRNVRIGSVHSV
ncbi:hypothetical protein C472_00379 [Halorubrum tebenquichense DSM 14210]|uniref:Uncharacterized protein n=1 Tax=Halorubrum tebenquichense DSM 14210 TaxID=1227485 RepID=M0E471_9EURY|nr:hypothetical protein C472_00379 [Halorubrum tebenquichense DSM 14210]